MSRPSYQELEDAWMKLGPSPRDSGEVALIVTRSSVSQMAKADRPPGYHVLRAPMHMQPSKVELCTQRGVISDRWSPKKNKPGDQLSLGSLAVARLVTMGSIERYHLFGNNFLIDFDLSADSLPVGTRLKLGTASIEITDEPYTPCNRYQARFGKEARRWVRDETHQARHLRGRYARVVTGGHVALNDRLTRS
ncbi:MAG: hypothetical protein GY811_04125 [Myxococcales bacterium]|nr:hypothetical protein [Myxococcales bacterium]